jgi:hypothetical protein
VGIVSRSAEPWTIFNSVGSPTFLGIAIVLLLACVIAFENRATKGKSLVWYHLQNLGIWLSFALGWFLVVPRDAMIGGEWELALALLLCALLGPLLRSSRTPEPSSRTPVTLTGPEAVREGP